MLMRLLFLFFFFKQKTAYGMRISDWSSDVCSSDLSDADSDEEEDDSSEEEEAGPTGPDPVEVERRMSEMASLYAKFQKSYAKNGPSAKPVLKLREEMAAIFVTNKLPLPLVDTLVRNLREGQGAIKDHERRILDLSRPEEHTSEPQSLMRNT